VAHGRFHSGNILYIVTINECLKFLMSTVNIKFSKKYFSYFQCKQADIVRHDLPYINLLLQQIFILVYYASLMRRQLCPLTTLWTKC